MSGHVYGWWVVTEDATGEEVRRIPSHYPAASINWHKVDDSLLYKIDYERFSTRWEATE